MEQQKEENKSPGEFQTTVTSRNSKIVQKEEFTDEPEGTLVSNKLPPIKKQRGQPKQGAKVITSEKKESRTDRLGNQIKKGSKFKVTFADQVTSDKLVIIHRVQSYKKYNLLTAREKNTYCS